VKRALRVLAHLLDFHTRVDYPLERGNDPRPGCPLCQSRYWL